MISFNRRVAVLVCT